MKTKTITVSLLLFSLLAITLPSAGFCADEASVLVGRWFIEKSQLKTPDGRDNWEPFVEIELSSDKSGFLSEMGGGLKSISWKAENNRIYFILPGGRARIFDYKVQGSALLVTMQSGTTYSYQR